MPDVSEFIKGAEEIPGHEGARTTALQLERVFAARNPEQIVTLEYVRDAVKYGVEQLDQRILALARARHRLQGASFFAALGTLISVILGSSPMIALGLTLGVLSGLLSRRQNARACQFRRDAAQGREIAAIYDEWLATSLDSDLNDRGPLAEP